MASPSSSAQRARQALADRLRELRQDAELTTTQLADLIGVHRTKVTKVETAQRRPSVKDVRAWCQACGAEDETEALLASLRTVESAYVEWRRALRGGYARGMTASQHLYENATTIKTYSSALMPGLVQTPDYARAVLATVAQNEPVREGDIDAAAKVRVNRQRFIRDGTRTLVCVLEEAVLRYQIGDPEVMDEQLRYLLSVMSWPTATVAVIPFGAARQLVETPLESFFLWQRAGNGDVVRVELLSARVQIEAPQELASYEKSFTALESMAVTGQPARRLINSARRAL